MMWDYCTERREKAMLSPKQQRALEALLVSDSRNAAAAAAGIDVKTMRKYLREEGFLTAYRAAFDAKVEDATRQAQQALAPALKTLLEICNDNKAGALTRISAARSILEYALKLGAQYDLTARVEALEKEAEENA